MFIQTLRGIPVAEGVPTTDEVEVARIAWIKYLQTKDYMEATTGKANLYLQAL